MTKDEYLDQIERFDLATQGAELLAFLIREGARFRDLLTDEEAMWVADQASMASMTLGLHSDAGAAKRERASVAP